MSAKSARVQVVTDHARRVLPYAATAGAEGAARGGAGVGATNVGVAAGSASEHAGLAAARALMDCTRTADSGAGVIARVEGRDGVAPEVEMQPGAALHDRERYRFLGEHGRGGLGRVSRAHDRALERDVAIKELIARGHIDEIRFLREALITARLEHPGIVAVHEAGRWPDGTPFYAMKMVSGRPLRELIAERKTVDQRLGLLH